MNFHINHIQVLAMGLLCIVIIGLIIKQQNNILTQRQQQNGYTAYNNATSKQHARDLMKAWQNNPVYFRAVKKIVFTDYIWMLFFGGTILYALIIGYYYSGSNWKAVFMAGIIFLILAIIIDIVQDNNIYRHLVKNHYSDFRYLTRPKFIILFMAIAIALTGIIKNWSIVLHNAFWK